MGAFHEASAASPTPEHSSGLDSEIDSEIDSEMDSGVDAERSRELNKGLPPLDLSSKPLAYFEFWPSWVFYFPVALYWLLMSVRYRSFGIPMLSNPNIELGGMVGESKAEILNMAGPKAKPFILPFITLTRNHHPLARQVNEAIAAATAAELEFPLVAKPDLGCRGAGVKVVRDFQALLEYLKQFPEDRVYHLQMLAPFEAEAGIFYQRMPNETKGRVTSITLKYVPWVEGDGIQSLKQLIEGDARAGKLTHLYFPRHQDRLAWIPEKGEAVPLAFAGSHSRGSIFRNGNHYITPALSTAIDAIMQDFPEFYYGRLDVKFNDIHRLMEGQDFHIIEVNGASSEATHIWDSRGSVWQVFSTIFCQYRTLFNIGRQMLKRGHRAPSVAKMISVWRRELKFARELPPAD